MIKTKYNITLQIDDIDYSITVSEPTKSQKQEIEVIAKDAGKYFEDRQQSLYNISEYTNFIDINNEIISASTDVEKKVTLLEENKTNLKKISKIKNEVRDIENKLSSIEVVIEDAYKKRFDLTVSGECKVSLQQIIEDSNIAYKNIFNAIAEETQKEIEKK